MPRPHLTLRKNPVPIVYEAACSCRDTKINEPNMEWIEKSSFLVGKLLEKRGTVVDRNETGVRKILYAYTKRVELNQECVINGFEDKGSPATVTEIITALILGALTPL